MLRRYAITSSLLLFLFCNCATSVLPTTDPCDGSGPCLPAAESPGETTVNMEMAELSPPAAATGLADRLRPIEPDLANPSTEPGDATLNIPAMQNQSDESLVNLLLGDIHPQAGGTLDPFTGQLLDFALLPDLLPLLSDSLISNLIEPGASLSNRTFLEQSCRNQGIEDFICQQRYGS